METILLSEETPLNPCDLRRLRHHASKVFAKLEQKIENDSKTGSPPPSSWVGTNDDTCDSENVGKGQPQNVTTETSLRKRYFDEYGFIVARGFCDPQQATSLKQAMGNSVQNHWFPDGACDDDKKQEKVTSFGTDAESNQARGDPFLESADKVSYFAEPTALDAESGSLKSEFCERNKKLFALCKAGHGLHLPPGFRDLDDSKSDETKTNDDGTTKVEANVHQPFFEYTSSSKLRELVLSLGYQDPVVPQSMYIFKNAKVGGAVHSHQDSTFLYTTPRQTCLGLWLALDDATLQNGCLWVRPGSHREPLRRQFLRNPKHQTDETEPKLTFETHHENSEVTWEGSLPKSVEVTVGDSDKNANTEHDNEDTPNDLGISSLNFIPVEVNAGDLVVFCGTLDHFSLPNFSDKQRHTFQLHLVEGPNAGVEWSPSNWLQYESEDNKRSDFLRLLDYANKETL